MKPGKTRRRLLFLKRGFLVELRWRAACRFTGFYMAYEMFAQENLCRSTEVKKRKDQKAGGFFDSSLVI